MALSDHFPEMKGWTSAPTSDSQKPQMPIPEVQSSPYLRATLPLPMQYAPDTLKQYNRPGLSSFRIAPLPPGGAPALNSASASVVHSSIQEFINTAAAGPNGSVQFNGSGALSGSNLFSWDSVSSALHITGSLTVTTPIAVSYGGTGSNLSVTGGTSQVLRQSSVGASVTVSQLTYADISGTLVNVALWNTTAKNSNYVAVAGDMVLATTTAPFTVTIPLSSANANLSIRVKKVSADLNAVTLTASGGDLIDGLASQSFNGQYTDIEITADGVGNWWVA